jgi:imidazolonepropionase-like amidohydrolase
MSIADLNSMIWLYTLCSLNGGGKMHTVLKSISKKLQENRTFKICAGVCLILGIIVIVVVARSGNNNKKAAENEVIAITNVRIFDGERIINERVVVINGAYIQSVGSTVPGGATVIDGQDATLLPGLIDSHVHTDMDGLRDALEFGVTTELEMNGRWTVEQREKISLSSDIADLRSPGMAVTPKGGHPSQYMSSSNNVLIRFFFRYPFVKTPEEVAAFINKEIAGGADYIKIMIENGNYIGFPGLPVLDDILLNTAVTEAHRNDKLAIAHVTTAEAAGRAINAGVDGLGHLFFDTSPSPALVADIASSGAFVVPTLVTLSTAFGNSASAMAADERVSGKLSKQWLESLSRGMNVYPQGNLEDAYATVKALHEAGVDILAGSDVSEPIPTLGGLAHGASLHHELQLLVAAGLEPIEALRAATSIPARRFGLTDRGRIVSGALADLVLIEGDPLTTISDTLSIRSVWRRGVQLQ